MKTAAQYIKERYPFYDENIENKDVELNGERVRELIRRVQQETAVEIKKRCMEECGKLRVPKKYVTDQVYNDAIFNCRQAIDRMEIE